MSLIDRVRESWNQTKDVPEAEMHRRADGERDRVKTYDERTPYEVFQPRSEDVDRQHIQSIVGIPYSREFNHIESQGDVHQYAAGNGSRINVDSKGQFYDGELRPIDRETASSYQRMTTEWQSFNLDDFRKLEAHLKEFTQPAIDRYVQEKRIEGMENASPSQQEELSVRLQQRLGLAEDSARFAVVTQVVQLKEEHGLRPTDHEAVMHEFFSDTLRGKDGPNYMRQEREEAFARKLAGPALEAFAEIANVSVARLTDEQVEQVGKNISERYQIPIAIATQQASWIQMDEGQKAQARDWALEQAVGGQNAEHYTWKQNSGLIDSYQNNATGRFVHLDNEGKFYDQSRTPVDATAALSHAEEKHTVAPHNENALVRPDIQRDHRAMEYQTHWQGKADHTLPGEGASSKIEVTAPKLTTPELSISM